jgi:hypothetical protein
MPEEIWPALERVIIASLAYELHEKRAADMDADADYLQAKGTQDELIEACRAVAQIAS